MLADLRVLLLLLASGARADPPFAIGGDPRVDPADFRITVFASGIDYPWGIQRLSDGSLLVGSSVPSVGSYFSSSGQVLRFVDADGDGVADAPTDRWPADWPEP